MSVHTALFARIATAVDQGEFDQAVTLCDQALSQDARDRDVYQVQIACLVRQDKYHPALECITRAEKIGHKDTFLFEKAYCQYRTEQIPAALQTLKRLEKRAINDPTLAAPCQKLAAQIAYRQGEYRQAMSYYDQLMQQVEADSPEYYDLLTNFLASQVGWALQEHELPTDQLQLVHSTYELAYNSACQLLCVGRIQQAEEYLRTAMQLCQQTLDAADASEEERQAELGVIEVQLAYAYQQQGKIREAETLYAKHDNATWTNAASQAVINHNFTAVHAPRGLSTTATQRLHAKNVNLGDGRLLQEQLSVMSFNSALLKFYRRKSAAARRDCRQTMECFGPLDRFRVLHAATWYQQGKPEVGRRELQQAHSEHPQSLVLLCSLVQAYVQEHKFSSALKVLQGYLDQAPEEQKYSAGFLSTLLWLYNKVGDKENMTTAIHQATSYWDQDNRSSQAPNALLQTLGTYYLMDNEPARAVTYFKPLVQRNPTDYHVMGLWLLALVDVDWEAAQEHASELPSVPRTADGITAEKLEVQVAQQRADSPKPQAKRAGKTAKVPDATPSESSKKPKPLPKNYDPTAKVDPERWLPLYQRSYYKPSKRDRHRGRLGKKSGSSGLQGAVVHGDQGALGGTGSANIHSSPAPTKSSDTKQLSSKGQSNSKNRGNQGKSKQQQKKKKKGTRF
ncbi:Signal recognition particle subunit SRP72 [Dispira simplex]|nr:Signal recognition particle subunit SRP72 [Dispira simplex]